MSRLAKQAFVILWITVSNAALAQIGLRTAEPTAPGKMRVLGAPSPCDIKEGWFPLTNYHPIDPKKTLCFWNQEDQAYLKYGRFVNTAKTISAATEVVSDAFGPVRVALSTAVAATTNNDQTVEDEDEPTPEQDRLLNLLAANGGNVALTASFPLYFKPVGGGSFLWNSYLRVAANASAFGGDTETTLKWGDVNGNAELAFTEMQLDLLSYQKNFNILGYLKTSAILGTDKFAETLHADASTSFLHGQAGAGVRIGQLLMIYLTYNWYSDDDIPGQGGSVTFALTK